MSGQTDKGRFIELLQSFGVGFTITEDGNIVCEEGDKKVDGYVGFYITFEFDESGKFIKMGIWE